MPDHVAPEDSLGQKSPVVTSLREPLGAKKITVILSAVVFLAVLVFAVYYYVFKKPAPKSPLPGKLVIYDQKDMLPPGFDKAKQDNAFLCPLSPELCKIGVIKESSFSAKFNKPASLIAAFDGEWQILKGGYRIKDSERFEDLTVGVLTNKPSYIRAKYYFHERVAQTPAPSPRGFKQGEVVATSSGKPIESFENNSLVFEFVKLNDTGFWVLSDIPEFKENDSSN